MNDSAPVKPARDLLRFARHFLSDQPVGFLASEALINPAVQDLIPHDRPAPTKFGRAIQAAERALPTNAFTFDITPAQVATAFELMRKDLRSTNDEVEAAVMLRDAPSFSRFMI
jgi:hypothetical protein